MEKEIILQAKNIHKSFYQPSEVTILKGVDLTVRKGETVAIVGRSGEGKSTLLQILGTLDSPCKGWIEVGGEAVSTFNKNQIRNEKLAFIFQSFYLMEDFSVIDNILFPAAIGRKSVEKGSESYEKGMQLLTRVGLSHRATFSANLLSGGEKQRAAIARALANDPDLILADEPTGNLDGHTAREVHEILLGLARQQGKSVIIVTHDTELANLCDTKYRLQDGKLLQM